MYRQNTVGSAWMIAAMASFAVEDAFFKVATQTLPIGQVLMLFGVGGMLLFAVFLRLREEPLFIAAVISPAMLIRLGFEITGRLFYALAIALTPLSSATVILQATPLVVVVGAVLVFKERVGWRRWSAIFIGLFGVLIIIQPGTTSFSLLSLLALIGMVGFAGRDLASRAAPKSVGTARLGFYGFLALVCAGGLYALWSGKTFIVPDSRTWLALLGTVVFGVAAYSCLMKAMRTGDVSAVTPFRYTRLVFGLALGVMFFGESLSPSMLMGALLVVISGLAISRS